MRSKKDDDWRDYQPRYTAPQVYRGVSYDPVTCTWRARMYCAGKHVTLGRFGTSREAAFVHDRAAYFIHGDLAQTNYGLEAARQSNAVEPPSTSWRVMATLEALKRETQLRQHQLSASLLSAQRSSIAAGHKRAASRLVDAADLSSTQSTLLEWQQQQFPLNRMPFNSSRRYWSPSPGLASRALPLQQTTATCDTLVAIASRLKE